MKNVIKAFVLSMFLATGAMAQDAFTDRDTGKVQMVVPQQAKKTVYNFEEVDILGNLKKPEGQTVISAPEFQFKKLLNLEESFIPNALDAVDGY